VYVAVDGVYAGCVDIADEIKEDAAEAVARLRKLGISKIAMLTGDREKVAEKIAVALDLDGFYPELLPEDKVDKVEKMKEVLPNPGRDKLVFVGDGINDAPVIAIADVGVAMGGLGSDAAIEAADVVIMEDAPSKLATAISISRRTRRIVYQNIVFSLFVKGVFLALGAIGIVSIWAAVFADVGVVLLAVLNSTRVLRYTGE
jgi:Cd2+/Zn2+-exporting ATPase